MAKSIQRIASSIVEGRGDDPQTFMMMRKMEWDEVEERRRQEREEARHEREEARCEREEMEDNASDARSTSNAIVPIKIDVSLIFIIKNCFNLIATHNISSEIVNQNN